MAMVFCVVSEIASYHIKTKANAVSVSEFLLISQLITTSTHRKYTNNNNNIEGIYCF